MWNINSSIWSYHSKSRGIEGQTYHRAGMSTLYKGGKLNNSFTRGILHKDALGRQLKLK